MGRFLQGERLQKKPTCQKPDLAVPASRKGRSKFQFFMVHRHTHTHIQHTQHIQHAHTHTHTADTNSLIFFATCAKYLFLNRWFNYLEKEAKAHNTLNILPQLTNSAALEFRNQQLHVHTLYHCSEEGKTQRRGMECLRKRVSLERRLIWDYWLPGTLRELRTENHISWFPYLLNDVPGIRLPRFIYLLIQIHMPVFVLPFLTQGEKHFELMECF